MIGEKRHGLPDEPDEARLYKAHKLLDTDPRQALSEFKILSQSGSAMSMIYLGDAYKSGIGTKADLVEAEQWYRRAADSGCLLAWYLLGRLYLKSKRYADATNAFETAAQNGYAPAEHYLGRMYSFGYGVERDIEKAKLYLERAVAGGSVFAKRRLAGLLLQEGKLGQRARGMALLIGSYKDFFRVAFTEGLTSDRLR